jgi:hypothetical protein
VKKLLAIAVTALLAFNLAGYQALTAWLQHRADEQLLAKVEEENFDEAEIIEISVPLNLPYTSDWQYWQPVSGTIQLDGIPYNYIAQKLTGGRMYYRCLPNVAKKMAINARDEFLKLAYNLTHGDAAGKQKSQSKVVISTTLGDYDDAVASYRMRVAHQQRVVHHGYLPQVVGLVYMQLPWLPPEA